MSRYWWSACAALVILGSGMGETVSLGKPPDLPVDLSADFEDEAPPTGVTFGFDIFTGKLSLSFSLPWNFWQPSLPAPSTVEAKGRPNAACPPREIMVPEAQESATAKLGEAHALFRIAERCRKNGDLDMARTCYEETHLLAPESSLGREAIQRLADIDRAQTSAGEGAGEAQEPREVPQDATFRDMLRKTVPLGR